MLYTRVTQSSWSLSVLFSSGVNWEGKVLPIRVAIEIKSLKSVYRSLDGDGLGFPQTEERLGLAACLTLASGKDGLPPHG